MLPQFLLPEDFGAKGDSSTDDSVAFQKLFDTAAQTHKSVYIPVPIKRYVWGTGVTLQPPPGQSQLSIKIECAPYPSGLIEFKGSGSALKCLGLKGSEIHNLRIRSFNSQTIGLDISADTLRNSTSSNLFSGFRFDSAPGTVSNVGIFCGTGLEGADISQNIFERCNVVADLGPQNKDVSYLKNCAVSGHRGFVWGNSNNLDNLVRMSGGYGQYVVFDHSPTEVLYGGNGTRYESCHPTFSILGWRIPGGFSVSIVGGRSEHMRSLVLHGDPLQAGKGTGRLSLTEHLSGGIMGLEETFGVMDPGIVVSMNNQAHADLTGLTLYNPSPKNWHKIMCSLVGVEASVIT